MTYYSVLKPYEVFFDNSGDPLEDGYIYIGEANQNPITNPVTVYWDVNGLYPAAQPIRTLAGYPTRNGSPGKIYINLIYGDNYSVTIKNKNEEIIYSDNKVLAENSYTGSDQIFNNVVNFGAAGNGITDDTIAIQTAIDVGGIIYFPIGTYIITTTLDIDNESTTLMGESFSKTILIGSSLDPVIQINNWYCEVKNIRITNGAVGIQVGTVPTKTNFFKMTDSYISDCSDAGLKVVNGNVGKIIGGLIEDCGGQDIGGTGYGLWFTDDTVDTNGWTVVGLRAYGCPTNFYLQGDANNRYVDDNFFWVTCEDYAVCGFRVSSVRNNINLYAESAYESVAHPQYAGVLAVGYLDETDFTSNWCLFTGNTNIDLTNGDFHGLSQGTSSIYYQNLEQIKFYEDETDLTVSSKTYQVTGYGLINTVINTSGATRVLNLQKLDARQLYNPLYFIFPSTNTGEVSLTLNDPAGYTYLTSALSTITIYPLSTHDRHFVLNKISSTQYALSELPLINPICENFSEQVDTSRAITLLNYPSGSTIDIQNDSGSSKNLTLNGMDSVSNGYEIYFYQDSASSTINLVFSGSNKTINGTTTLAMGGSTGRYLKKMESNRWLWITFS